MDRPRATLLLQGAVLLCLVTHAVLQDGEQQAGGDVSSSVCGGCSCGGGLLDCSGLPLEGGWGGSWLWPRCECAAASNLTAVFRACGIKVLFPLPEQRGVSSLSLRHNRMVDIHDGAFAKLPGLVELDLSHNLLQVEDVRPTVLRGAYSPARYEPMALQLLDLSYNQLHSLDPQAFEHCPRLTVLRLDYNPLKVIDGPTLRAVGTPHLQELGLAGAQLSAVPRRLLEQLASRRSLRALRLSDNNLTAVPDGLQLLDATLEELNLSATQLEQLDDESLLGEWPRLRSLALSAMPRLRRLGPRALSSLTQLEQFLCAFNGQLHEVHPLATAGLENLRWVRLDNNALERLGADSLRWSSLAELKLEGNPWRCDCSALQWLSQQAADAITDQPRCAAPESLRDTGLASLNASALCAAEWRRGAAGAARGRKAR
ncbi:chondroadherin-like protein, partial [Schistocerca serialis cubense]|uniref:chondroadherin-like protein n=1 Tax=Schistocerca serialis cubense TaxID=2023355 RepID=UPI00214DF7A5